MTTAQELKEARENRAAVYAKIEALDAKISTDQWEETRDGAELDSLNEKLREAEAKVIRLEEKLDREARAASWTTTTTDPQQRTMNVTVLPEGRRGDIQTQAKTEFRLLKAVRETIGKGLTGLEAEMMQEAEKEARSLGLTLDGNLFIPSFFMEKRDMVAGTTTAGGYTIQTDIGGLIPLLDPRPVVRRMGATFLTGLTGNIDFPRNDAGATATWATEVATAGETSPTFDRVQMSPNRLAAFTDISKQVMIQSTINMENFVRNRLTQAVSNALDSAALNGAGGSEPTGIAGTSGINSISIAASPTWAKIVDFETQVAADDADFGNLAYLTTPQIAGILKTIKRDTAGNGFIWEGNNNGSGQINGYGAFVSTLVPTTGGAHYMYFGNWSKLLIGQWGGLDIMVNPYTKAKEATVEVIVNSFWDVAVEHPVAFALSTSVHPS